MAGGVPTPPQWDDSSVADLVAATLDLVGFATSSDAPNILRRRAAMVALTLCDADVAVVISETGGERAAGDGSPLDGVIALADGVSLGEEPNFTVAPLNALVHAGEPMVIDDVAGPTVSSADRSAVGRWAVPVPVPGCGALSDGRPLRSFLGAPALASTGFQRAAVVVGSHRTQAFGPLQVRRLAAMGSWLGPALDVRERLTESGRVADALQGPLLPPLPPDLPFLDVAARYRAADDSSRVGGDFYDLDPTSVGSWRVVIGDVCGAGPEAAAVTGVARYTLRATAVANPAAALRTLNSAILEHTHDQRFLTAVCISVQPGSEGVQAVLCTAGHPSPLVVRADGTVEEASVARSTLLGVFDEPVLTDETLDLAVGDALVLYTDGVTEAHQPGGEQFGEGRLAELLSSCAGRTADGIARRIELAARDHLGSHQHDDMAIVVLRATGVA
jgi:hypothetical protein